MNLLLHYSCASFISFMYYKAYLERIYTYTIYIRSKCASGFKYSLSTYFKIHRYHVSCSAIELISFLNQLSYESCHKQKTTNTNVALIMYN